MIEHGRLNAAITAIAVGMLWLVGGAHAQAVDSDLAACAAIESEAERLACYDRALRPQAEPAPTTEPEPAPTPEPAVAVEEPEPLVVEPPAEIPRRESERARRRAERAVAREAHEEAGDIDVVIVTMQANLSGLLVLETEAGDILEQVSARAVRFPDPPFAARLSPASIGTYFLAVEGSASRIRVRLRE